MDTPVTSRRLVEFQDYTEYFGSRLYPRVGKLSLIGSGFVFLFTFLDVFVLGSGRTILPMLGFRALSGSLLVVIGLRLQHRRKGIGPARLTLLVGIVSFLALVSNYIIVSWHLELVAVSMAIFLMGVHALAPLLPLSEYTAASIVTLVVLVSMVLGSGRTVNDLALLALFTVPLQLFLGVVLYAAQHSAHEQYHLARQNFIGSAIDSLSQLLNRRAWFEACENMTERRTSEHVISFMMLDIDHFKQVNDRYGHPCGDLVIQRVAEILLEETRNGDLVGRLGGEEFGILLLHADQKGAQTIAERIRTAVESKVIQCETMVIPVTVSIGFTTWTSQNINLASLVQTGDKALYAAKNGGRNRVVFVDLSSNVTEPRQNGWIE